MILSFETWEDDRKNINPLAEQKLIKDLIFESVYAKKINSANSNYVFSDCFYNNGWNLSWQTQNNTVAEFSFECLKIHILNNNVSVENFKFFRSIDLFYRALLYYEFKILKEEWIQGMMIAATQSNHHKSKIFVANLKQYIEKEQLIRDIENLL
jgi:hypothetical protein